MSVLKYSVKHFCETNYKNMPNNITIGQIGEELACCYLLNNKYRIVERNYREVWGEIDIICKAKDGTLVFVEVKTLRTQICPKNVSQECFTPENNLSPSKLKKVKRTSYMYANNNSKLVDEASGWRIDLLAVDINHSNPENLDPKELLKYCQIRHYENI